MTPTRRTTLTCFVLSLALACGAAQAQDPNEPSRKLTGTSFYKTSDEFFVGADLRAAWIGGTRNQFPLYVVLIKTKGNDFLEFARQSFVLQLPDNTLIPLGSYEDYIDHYQRGRADSKIVDEFLASLSGRFPQPPYEWQPMDLFPPRASGIFPRKEFAIRGGQLWHGYLYFPLPEDPPQSGRYTLQVFPNDVAEPYVVDFPPFGDDKAAK